MLSSIYATRSLPESPDPPNNATLLYFFSFLKHEYAHSPTTLSNSSSPIVFSLNCGSVVSNILDVFFGLSGEDNGCVFII